MADYYPLIARAVAGLEQNTGENRRVLYERARTALVSQLRGTVPPLEEGEITRERLALEDAIRRIESESSRRVRADAPIEEEQAPAPPPVAVKPAGPSLTERGLRGFREIAGEAEKLGDAAGSASRAAREVQTDHERPHEGEETHAPPTPETTFAPEEPAAQLPHGEDFAASQAAEPTPDTMQGEPFQPGVERSQSEAAEPSAFEAERAAADTGTWKEPPVTPRYVETEEDFERPPARSYRGVIRAALILLVIGGLAAAGWFFRGNIESLWASMRSSPAPTAQQTAPAPGRQKITDRVGGDQGRSSTAPAADVAQKVVLYDEDPNDAQGKRYVGSAIWRTETVSPGPGLAPELALRADVEIPERRIRMTWSLRRNTDRNLPASHTIEIMFALPADFPEGGIQNVPGVLMKQNEQARGIPLAGLAVKVTNNFFLIGLSAVPIDRERNVQLLKERAWFDVPLVYNTSKRAILALEKGTPGERLFEEAFRTWGQ